MQCILTSDTAPALLALALGAAACALALLAEVGALAMVLRWRGVLLRWSVALAAPLALAGWCVLRARAAWGVYQSLVTPPSCTDAGCGLWDLCGVLPGTQQLALASIIAAGVALAAGLLLLFALPPRRVRPVRRARPTPAVWPVTWM